MRKHGWLCALGSGVESSSPAWHCLLPRFLHRGSECGDFFYQGWWVAIGPEPVGEAGTFMNRDPATESGGANAPDHPIASLLTAASGCAPPNAATWATGSAPLPAAAGTSPPPVAFSCGSVLRIGAAQRPEQNLQQLRVVGGRGVPRTGLPRRPLSTSPFLSGGSVNGSLSGPNSPVSASRRDAGTALSRTRGST
ncbi:hypothetical protein DHEL01_v201622 [Diaporthe helianthi]|uniref:Uncharacterized protein n=1 Tax=Diaporthe helianthi TaxID=158607 RepID=A0A2P5IBU1_DIAHE|nr:hypothetical protein DHEL01_v201622 [Diaporthe helianthi]